MPRSQGRRPGCPSTVGFAHGRQSAHGLTSRAHEHNHFRSWHCAHPRRPPRRTGAGPATARLPVDRRVNCRGSITVARQKIHVGIGHAGATVTVEDADTTLRVYDGDRLLTEATKPIARFKPQTPTATPPSTDYAHDHGNRLAGRVTHVPRQIRHARPEIRHGRTGQDRHRCWPSGSVSRPAATPGGRRENHGTVIGGELWP